MMKTAPGYQPMTYERFLYCGLRDQSEVQRARVIDSGMLSIWGNSEQNIDFVNELEAQLDERSYSPAFDSPGP